MDASLGGTSFPAPLDVFVTDADIAPFREAFERKQRWIKPAAGWVFLALVVGTVMFGFQGRSAEDFFSSAWGLFVVITCSAAMWARRESLQNAERTFHLAFSSAGLDFAAAFTGDAVRHFSWRALSSLSDTGTLLIITAKLGPRIVLPKRCFDDRGDSVIQFVAAHGVKVLPATLP